jgi:hypothetical protein
VMAGFNNRKIGIRANHHDVCKFTERDAGYKRASTFIIDLASEATSKQHVPQAFRGALPSGISSQEIPRISYHEERPAWSSFMQREYNSDSNILK